MNAMQQTDQEKWKALADAIGWKHTVFAEGKVAIFAGRTTRYGIRRDFRDAILKAIERTPLEMAAPEMAKILLDLYDAFGSSPRKNAIGAVLKKAEVIE